MCIRDSVEIREPDREACYGEACSWDKGPWQCNTTCGLGLAVREVTCAGDGLCAGVKPRQERPSLPLARGFVGQTERAGAEDGLEERYRRPPGPP